MKGLNIFKISHVANCHLFIKQMAVVSIALCFFACGDQVINTEKSISDSNSEFKLTLTVSDEIVRLDDSIKLTAIVERKVHIDSIDGYVSMKIILDAVGGTIDGHGFSSASNITVTMDDAAGSKFQALAFFLPKYSYNSSKNEYYSFMEKGHISATFDGISVSIPINMVEPR